MQRRRRRRPGAAGRRYRPRDEESNFSVNGVSQDTPTSTQGGSIGIAAGSLGTQGGSIGIGIAAGSVGVHLKAESHEASRFPHLGLWVSCRLCRAVPHTLFQRWHAATLERVALWLLCYFDKKEARLSISIAAI